MKERIAALILLMLGLGVSTYFFAVDASKRSHLESKGKLIPATVESVTGDTILATITVTLPESSNRRYSISKSFLPVKVGERLLVLYDADASVADLADPKQFWIHSPALVFGSVTLLLMIACGVAWRLGYFDRAQSPT